jgi:protein tyrosine phosphatase (PTP) superfamily phosphohydrolase (DUF442 family)
VNLTQSIHQAVFAVLAFSILNAGAQNVSDNGTKLPRSSAVQGIENVWVLDDRLYCGGDPGGAGGMALLKRLGVRSLVSVDGAAPDVEAARIEGLRYVHIPIGYDGIDTAARTKLVRAFKELPGPIYVHCHHGKHRGPAAAMIMARSGVGWSAEEGVTAMQRIGTSPDYPGLFAAVRDFREPTANEISQDVGPLPESVEVPALVEMMVNIDNRFDRLKAWVASRDPETTPVESAKGIDPRQEAIHIRELTREAARLPECRDKPEKFARTLTELEHEMTQWIEAFDGVFPKKPDHGPLSQILKQASAKCVSCHRDYRDK